jgi:hypothetical protein
MTTKGNFSNIATSNTQPVVKPASEAINNFINENSNKFISVEPAEDILSVCNIPTEETTEAPDREICSD